MSQESDIATKYRESLGKFLDVMAELKYLEQLIDDLGLTVSDSALSKPEYAITASEFQSARDAIAPILTSVTKSARKPIAKAAILSLK